MTGHRAAHPSFPTEPALLSEAMQSIFAAIEHSLEKANAIDRTVRLLTLLSDGTDQMAASLALHRKWELLAPLPFGRRLNAAINSGAKDEDTIGAILAGKPPSDPDIANRVAAIEELADHSALFELADDDAKVEKLLLNAAKQPDDRPTRDALAAAGALRAALAGRILVEQSDLLIAVWDGQSTASIGGTGHTALMALESSIPVLWIDPKRPSDWSIVFSPEELTGTLPAQEREAAFARLDHIVAGASAAFDEKASAMLASLELREQSSLRAHPFRRIQSLFGEREWSRKFGSIRQRYEQPRDVSQGSGQPVVAAIGALTPGDDRQSGKITSQILERHVWLDGIAAHYSDRHRSGMILNFLLGAFAIIIGVLYLPLVEAEQKWIFAAAELVLLLAIVLNTIVGRRRELHSRWFETRRAAEYLRHSPLLAALGVARSKGEWPRTMGNSWPETYAQQVSRAVSLPNARVDETYLRTALSALRDHHIDAQRLYHEQKSELLDHVHHGLDRLSESLFAGAVFVVSIFLCFTFMQHLGWMSEAFVMGSGKWFTVLAVALPTLGGAFEGVRYFGDFERFADISKVTAAKLDAVSTRIEILLQTPKGGVTYDRVTDIAHATDQIVFDEIQSWQSVFSSKILTVPA